MNDCLSVNIIKTKVPGVFFTEDQCISNRSERLENNSLYSVI